MLRPPASVGLYIGVEADGEVEGSMSTGKWWDVSWNPITGCTHCSRACYRCWAAGIAKRFWKGRKFSDIRFHPERLEQPLHWRKPRRVFVCDMGDLFHDNVPGSGIEQVLNVMVHVPQHTFYLLTKRIKRAAEYRRWLPVIDKTWPDNVWLGVTVWDQASADENIPFLLQTPAAHRFVSIEPMLGPVDLTRMILVSSQRRLDALRGIDFTYIGPDENGRAMWDDPVTEGPALDWVILGGETGPGARPMEPDWARRVRDDCAAAGVPFWLKSMGEWHRRVYYGASSYYKLSRLLDGFEHNGRPEGAHSR